MSIVGGLPLWSWISYDDLDPSPWSSYLKGVSGGRPESDPIQIQMDPIQLQLALVQEEVPV